MHAAEQPNGKFYRPVIAGPGRSSRSLLAMSEVQASIPDDVRTAIWVFLERRASFLMGAPGLDMKTYAEHPPKDRLSHGEDAATATNTYSDGYAWPPRWGLYERRFSHESVMGQVYALMNNWRNDLRSNRKSNGLPREVIDAIGEVISGLYFASTMHVSMPERRESDEDGYCREDFKQYTLREDAQSDLAEFACAAHNAMITLLHWLDQDIPARAESLKARDERYRQEREMERKLDSLIAREKRHAAAVKRVKDKLVKEKAEAERLLAEANQRMSEAMSMAALVAKIEETQ